MACRIAICGKGGVGKSTFAALAVRCLSEERQRPVLAVDADPNATLGALLGIQADASVADIREETLEKKDAIPSGMSKDQFVEFRIQQCISEHKGFDLLTMGRPEGPGCYCFVNSLLRRYLERVADDYPYVVIDNEAGMEHLSRRTDGAVDLMLIVTEPTVVGADTVQRIAALARKLRITVKKKAVVLNRVPPAGVPEAIRDRIAAARLPIAGEIPVDAAIAEAAAAGRSLRELPADSPMFASVCRILGQEVPGRSSVKKG